MWISWIATLYGIRGLWGSFRRQTCAAQWIVRRPPRFQLQFEARSMSHLLSKRLSSLPRKVRRSNSDPEWHARSRREPQSWTWKKASSNGAEGALRQLIALYLCCSSMHWADSLLFNGSHTHILFRFPTSQTQSSHHSFKWFIPVTNQMLLGNSENLHISAAISFDDRLPQAARAIDQQALYPC